MNGNKKYEKEGLKGWHTKKNEEKTNGVINTKKQLRNHK